MKRLLVLLLGILLLMIAVALTAIIMWQSSFEVTEEEKTDKNVYENKDYGFEISYAKEFVFNEGADEMYNVGTFFTGSGKSLATLAFPENSYFGTNYQHAFLTIAVSDAVKNANECRKFYREGEISIKVLSNEKIINDTRFAWEETTGAAAGTMAETKIYHTLVKEKCFEITLNLFTGNIGNYELGTVTEVNKTEIWQKLEEILATLKFEEPGIIGEKTENGSLLCIQVITRARNPLTGEERDFPTPCDVPPDWETIQP